MFRSFTGLLLSSVGSAADRTSAMKFTYIISSSLCAVQRESKWTSHGETWARKGGTDRRQRAKSPKEKPFNKLNYYNIKSPTSHDGKSRKWKYILRLKFRSCRSKRWLHFFSREFHRNLTTINCGEVSSAAWMWVWCMRFWGLSISTKITYLSRECSWHGLICPSGYLTAQLVYESIRYVNAVGRSEFDFTPSILHSIFFLLRRQTFSQQSELKTP